MGEVQENKLYSKVGKLIKIIVIKRFNFRMTLEILD